MRVLPLALAFIVGLVAPPALAQRICVVPFSGPGGPPVRNQIIAGLCDAADCVAPAKATSSNKPDWKKAKRESIAFFITGAISKKGRATNLTLQVALKPGKPKLSKTYPVANGELSAKSLAAATAALKEAIGASGVEKTPAVAPPPKPVEQPVAPPPERTPEPARPVAEPTPAPPPEPVVEKKADRRQHFVAVELGADALFRNYDYVAKTTSNLRKYDSFFVLPSAKLELYPLALSSRGIIAGLGIEGGVSLATWLKSSRLNSTDVYPTSTMRIDAGLVWRIMPGSDFDLAFYPIVGIRMHRFVVGADSSGTRLDGLPNLNYFGLRAGLGLDIPLANKLLVIFARFVAIPVFGSGEVISSAFFARGSNFGLEGNAGVGIRLVNHLYLRLAFDFTRYSLTFKTSASDTYIAAGAVDQYLGGTASLRFEY